MFSMRSEPPQPRQRRGAALLLVLIMTTALAALALSAIYLMGTATTLSRTGERDAELRNAADAALQLVRSYLVTDAAALPDTGFQEFPLDSGGLRDAQGTRIAGTGVRVWFGPTGTPTTTGTSFADIIAQASDTRGGSIIRRLQVTRESFAKFAYFSDRESATSGTIYFAPGDVLFGPVWSNDTISIMSGNPNADFRDSVWTAWKSVTCVIVATTAPSRRAMSTSLAGAAIISANSLCDGGAERFESCGISRANAATNSSVASSATSVVTLTPGRLRTQRSGRGDGFRFRAGR